MNEQELLAAVHALVSPHGGDLVCALPGHGTATGHTCLAPGDGIDVLGLGDALTDRYGRPRNLAADGYVDPTVNERTGAPLLAPFGDGLVGMRAWADTDRWIGCGTVRAGAGVRPVVLVAGRATPGQEELPPDTSWVDQVVAVTGWPRDRRRPVDWAPVETRLGTALPDDYKELVERFGYGAFDDDLGLHLPDGWPGGAMGIAGTNEFWFATATPDGEGPWAPYRLYPAPGGLLEWASTEQHTSFYWLTGHPDPNRWPILVTDETYSEWDRFDGPTAQFIHRMLTDRHHPYSTARFSDSHWFTSYDSPDACDV
ncbi:hypothetical protein SUDANB105_04032 [Streptomyces sp. enrichment culture]|uniref:SMI1/KNR4 family protein n=1 Tax=Streptomyces sp. enrichment culture TaxID=1795815 RepID=UPI003F54AEE1